MIRKILAATFIAASLGAAVAPASAQVIVRSAPPEPRAENAPGARRDRTWVAGHWAWRNNRHQWVQGRWVRDRRGYTYNQPTWVKCDDCWTLQPGTWTARNRDRDGDGVPNRRDRAPNNPNRN